MQVSIDNVVSVSNLKRPNDELNELNDELFDNVYVIIGTEKKVLKFNTVKQYIDSICQKTNTEHLDTIKLTKSIYPKLKDVNTSDEIKEQIISCSTEMILEHYDYPKIAMWIIISDLHASTHDDYLKVLDQMRSNINANNEPAPIISDSFYEYVKQHHEEINQAFHYERDYDISYFGYRTLEKSYLKRLVNGKIIERPQHLFMRVAIALHYRKNRIDKILETYHYMTKDYFTHASPTLFNAGTNFEQLASCFLLGVNDSMESIGNCWKDCATISKHAGGIGICVTSIRCNGSYIHSTQGRASGLRVLPVFNGIFRYADQGGKRPGSGAFYIEPWHGDIFYFLELRKPIGAETERARDLFLGLMINDIFMERVEKDGKWSLMCPSICPDLLNKYGQEFTDTYIRYESEGKYIKQINARDLWYKILETQIHSGSPYIAFKNAVNSKSNQKNLGVINQLNLCAEIAEIATADMYSVCNLSSICLPKFINYNEKTEYDYQLLYRISRIVARNLDNIIDINYYPVEKTRMSNIKYRPIAVGVQGLADVYAIFEVPFDSDFARDQNKKIFETIYFGALTESVELAKENGPYEGFHGSPLSQGKFQFDLWGLDRSELSGMWDWDALMVEIQKYGVRNSLVTACMPTASTSQIKGNSEMMEPVTENIYTRKTMAGDYYVVNKYLMKILMKLNLWNSEMVDLIKYYNGSIAKIPGIPDNIKQIFRTVWEIPKKSIIEMAADRGAFIDQTQSMNLHIAEKSFIKLTSCLFHAWRLGLKTGMYYLHSKAASEANQFGIDIDVIKRLENKYHIQKDEPKTEETPVKPIKNIPICKYVPKHLRKQGECLSCDG